jgi:cytoskeletal protein CcmA (bactofilin family)
MADQDDDRGLPFRPAQGTRSGTGAGGTPASSPHKSEPQGHPHGKEVDVRTMIVGAGTAFSGQITSCNRLIVEGTLDGKLNNCQHVVIEESGIFRGESSTDNADVRGSFDGVLVVRKRLLVRAAGRVSGKVTYTEIEIEPGGKITGTLHIYAEGTMPDPRRAPAAKAMTANRRDQRSARPHKYSGTGARVRNGGKRNRPD